MAVISVGAALSTAVLAAVDRRPSGKQGGNRRPGPRFWPSHGPVWWPKELRGWRAGADGQGGRCGCDLVSRHRGCSFRAGEIDAIGTVGTRKPAENGDWVGVVDAVVFFHAADTTSARAVALPGEAVAAAPLVVASGGTVAAHMTAIETRLTTVIQPDASLQRDALLAATRNVVGAPAGAPRWPQRSHIGRLV